MNPYEIIKYKNESIELDICVSKNKETLWLTNDYIDGEIVLRKSLGEEKEQ